MILIVPLFYFLLNALAPNLQLQSAEFSSSNADKNVQGEYSSLAYI